MKGRQPTRLAVVVVAVLLGLLAVVQLRSQNVDAGLARLSNQDLTLLIGNLTTRNDQLRTELAGLTEEVAALGRDRAAGESSIDTLTHDLERTRGWGGLDAVTGRGVRVEIAGQIDAASVEAVLNELANAGAEAVAVDGVRVVAGTVVRGSPDDLSVQGRRIASSFAIVAIGDPGVLTASLTRAGGLITQLAASWTSTEITVNPLDQVTVPATTRVLILSLASPAP